MFESVRKKVRVGANKYKQEIESKKEAVGDKQP